jgi:hypothetical protein
MKKKWFILLIFALMFLACAPSATESAVPETVAPHAPAEGQPTMVIPTAAQEQEAQAVPAELAVPAYTGLNLNTLEGYSSSYTISMSADYDWRYMLTTRKNGSTYAYDLHIEGVKAAYNPGDVRLVTDGEMSWMIGPATDGECVQFSKETDLGRSFLTPDDLLDPGKVAQVMGWGGTAEFFEIPVIHLTAQGVSVDGWQDASLDIWLVEEKGQALHYTFKSIGKDPLFNAGVGTLTADFSVTEIGAQVIEPVMGCEHEFSLLDDARRLIILPGVISYESDLGLEEISAFYQTTLEEDGWLALDYPRSTDDAIVLSYRRGSEGVDVNIEQLTTGSKVTLLTFD